MLIYVSIFLSCVIAVQFYVILRFSNIIFSFESEIENCLDQTDESYNKISEILEKPLFYDSPEVRDVLRHIESVNVSFLSMSQRLARIQVSEDVEPDWEE